MEVQIRWDGPLHDESIENARLKRMYADERLKSDILQDALSKKF